MFKKVVIADSLAETVDSIFNNYQHENGVTLIIGAIAFSFQIYGDFSGYSDIALGTAKLFGFELLSNFKFPYFSRDVAEFWRRWHISLSSWFRDYLYIPLGGSKNGKYKAIRNTFIIFLVSGFWHGASWNFIAWGFIHACGFLPLLLLNRNRKHVTDVVAQDRKLPNIKELWQMTTTFAFVTFAWVFFRAKDLGEALGYIERICVSINYNPKQFLGLPGGKMAFLYIIPLILGDWWFRRNERSLKMYDKVNLRIILYLLLLLIIFIKFGGNSSFIYFQF
jgi:D-alanyl-lipoteichoic acid acyltransferase DltB (MBOAT superfamily)